MSVSIKFEGMEQLQRQFQSLSREIQEDIQRKASVDSVRDLAKGIRAEAPARTGNLKRSIIGKKTADKMKVSNNFIFADVVATRVKGKSGGYYVHLVRDGHKLVKATKFGLRKVIGAVQGNDFIKRGVDQNENKVVEDFFESVRRRVEKFNRGS